QQAMRLAPRYSYLPYNLGLVYQRLNRRNDAEAAYSKAIAIAPDSGEPYNALGSLKASTGKFSEAEQLYRQALAKNPALLAASYNLGLLLSSRKDRLGEAIALWRGNLQRDPQHLPSRLSLAAALDDSKAAIVEYQEILKIRPDYVAARLALADLLVKTGDHQGAVTELREALKTEPRSSTIHEKIGDVEKSRNRSAEAAEAYRRALELAPDSTTRKRIRKKQ
ncbi:MAG: tetratricopeptide repeat protein, partial [Bryobacteraceae bacterium]